MYSTDLKSKKIAPSNILVYQFLPAAILLVSLKLKRHIGFKASISGYFLVRANIHFVRLVNLRPCFHPEFRAAITPAMSPPLCFDFLKVEEFRTSMENNHDIAVFYYCQYW